MTNTYNFINCYVENGNTVSVYKTQAGNIGARETDKDGNWLRTKFYHTLCINNLKPLGLICTKNPD